MGIVYLMTNEGMPGLVKIGRTDDDEANKRKKSLFTTGVPFPFEVVYACRTENASAVEAALHVAFAEQRVNPRREFFRMHPKHPQAILELLSGGKNSYKEMENEIETGSDDEVSLASLQKAKSRAPRRPSLDFAELNIPVGAKLELVNDQGVKVVVVGSKLVRIEGKNESLSLSLATKAVLGISYQPQPGPYWTYNGSSIYALQEELWEKTKGEPQQTEEFPAEDESQAAPPAHETPQDAALGAGLVADLSAEL